MTEQGTTPHAMGYGTYLKAWVVLLFLTILMVMIANPAFLIAGMTVKALIIALYFMHLRHERRDFTLYMLLGLFLTSLLLFGLIIPDGRAM